MDFEKVKANLQNKGFDVTIFETKEDASKYLDEQIDGKSIGFGGSQTLEQMGVLEKLKSHNNVLFRFGGEKSPEEVMKEALTADIFLTSANGIAETGEIVNIDGNCNRIAGELYGHEKVYIIVGINKFAPDFDGALWRARNISAPKNAIRLGFNTPCAVNGGGKCFDCSHPQRICKGLTVLWQKPRYCPYEVVIINEELGY